MRLSMWVAAASTLGLLACDPSKPELEKTRAELAKVKAERDALQAKADAARAVVAGDLNARMKTDEDKTFYALGLFEGQRVSAFNMSPAELDLMKAGLADQVSGAKPLVELPAYQPKLQALYEARRKAGTEKEKEKAKTFLEAAAKEAGAKKTESGLVYTIVKEGKGPSPQASDVVKVNYEGRLTDGTVFDSSYARHQPAEFPLGAVIKCWTEGVQKLKVGGKAKLVCPSHIAYGEGGSPPKIPGGATLVFDVELLEIVKK